MCGYPVDGFPVIVGAADFTYSGRAGHFGGPTDSLFESWYSSQLAVQGLSVRGLVAPQQARLRAGLEVWDY